MHRAAIEVDVFPAKPEELTAPHSRFERENDEWLQQGGAPPIAGFEQAPLFTPFEATLSALWDARSSHELHRVAWQVESPLARRNVDRVRERVQLPNDRRGRNAL